MKNRKKHSDKQSAQDGVGDWYCQQDRHRRAGIGLGQESLRQACLSFSAKGELDARESLGMMLHSRHRLRNVGRGNWRNGLLGMVDYRRSEGLTRGGVLQELRLL